ncbi:DUF4251 domain-containing protein [uncultured Dokdonia sp.]|uniref:DUF4251 domain-containing protein n=1 Tax=uncultured Dokdonia sp. TaxID=575653 RepID=UPI0026250896|nr:DUF4251 domain-containing protein [uncultured Dokdonia sp.]
MKIYLLVISFVFTISQVTWSQSRSERKALKIEAETKAYQDVKSLLDSGAFFFNADWVYPRISSQINLVDNPGIIRFKSTDSVKVHLPYFGVIRIGGGFDQSTAIQHNGAIADYKIEHNDKKRSSMVTFTAKSPSETYDISMTVFSNGSTSIFVNSTKRDGIRYRGVITLLEETSLTKS